MNDETISAEQAQIMAEQTKLMMDRLNDPSFSLPTSLPTEYPVCPVMECDGQVIKYLFEIIPFKDKRTDEMRTFGKITVTMQLLSSEAEEAKGPNPTSSLQVNVDVDENGDIVTEKRNQALGRLLTAFGCNEPGVPLGAMMGVVRRVKINNITDDTLQGPVTSDFINGVYDLQRRLYMFNRKPRRLA